MVKVLHINVTANSGSHGRIAEEIGGFLIENGHECTIAYGREANKCKSGLIKIGKKADIVFHIIKTRILDRHGFGSIMATKSFIRKIDEINPDLIHLHNLHGYYLNIELLFKYLRKRNKPVIWTLHDCWSFTGHCSYFDRVNCFRWKTECYDCPNSLGYPKSWFVDNSRKNYYKKKELFSGFENLILVSPSEWLAQHLSDSYLSGYEIQVINNGVDTEKFKHVDIEEVKIKYNINHKYILGIASSWAERKGLQDLKRLRMILDPAIEIVLVGLTRKQINSLPAGMIGITRTENINELAAFYSGAEVFVNPTYLDNFPSVNIEALACGTSVVTYNTGGSPESVSPETGRIVQKGDIEGLKSEIEILLDMNRQTRLIYCRDRATKLYDSKIMSRKYFSLYERLLGGKDFKKIMM